MRPVYNLRMVNLMLGERLPIKKVAINKNNPTKYLGLFEDNDVVTQAIEKYKSMETLERAKKYEGKLTPVYNLELMNKLISIGHTLHALALNKNNASEVIGLFVHSDKLDRDINIIYAETKKKEAE